MHKMYGKEWAERTCLCEEGIKRFLADQQKYLLTKGRTEFAGYEILYYMMCKVQEAMIDLSVVYRSLIEFDEVAERNNLAMWTGLRHLYDRALELHREKEKEDVVR